MDRDQAVASATFECSAVTTVASLSPLLTQFRVLGSLKVNMRLSLGHLSVTGSHSMSNQAASLNEHWM